MRRRRSGIGIGIILSNVLTATLSISLSICGTSIYFNLQKTEEHNQNVVINIDGTEVAFNAQDIEDLNSKISDLESENRRLQDKIEENNNSGQIIVDNTNNKRHQNEIIYLNELPFYNCQFYSDSDGAWTSSSIPDWNVYEDKAADGKNYNNAVHMVVNTSYKTAQMFVIDYLLDAKYATFNGSFMLDEISKSTSSEATLRIYGDDVLLYECSKITGGLIPQNTGNVSVENVKRLRFEFSSDYGSIGNYYDNYFGVVFYDTFLECSS